MTKLTKLKQTAVGWLRVLKRVARTLAHISKRTLPYVRKPQVAVPVLLVAIVLAHTLYVGVIARYVTHNGKTFPNTVVAGQDVGGLDERELTEQLAALLVEQSVEVTYGSAAKTFTPQALGLSVDAPKLTQLITQRDGASAFRPWFVPHDHTLPIRVDDARLAKALHHFKDPDFTRPTGAAFTFADGEFKVMADKPGLGFDVREIGDQLRARLGERLEPLTVTAIKTELQAAVQTQDIRSVETTIKDYAAKTYQVTSSDKTVTANKTDVATWLRIEKTDGKPRVVIDASAVQQYVAKAAAKFKVAPRSKVIHQFVSGKSDEVATSGRDGKAVSNVDGLAQGLLRSLERGEAYRGGVTFKRLAFKTETKTIDDVGPVFTYEVITWGKVKADLGEFAAQVAQTLGDKRGWSAAGMQFKRVSSGGDFSVVLSEPARVDSAAPICDAYYSCRVGRYVIINDARWRGATPAWNNAGGSLRNYRHMLVNHETGHWLGYGHRYCPAPDAPAPVMQQQSISLQGCAFNSWPVAAEIAAY